MYIDWGGQLSLGIRETGIIPTLLDPAHQRWKLWGTSHPIPIFTRNLTSITHPKLCLGILRMKK